MLHRANYYERINTRGPPQHFGQRQWEQFANRHQGYPKDVEIHERCNWLSQLGLSYNCAYNIAVHTLELPEFNAANFQQRWKRLRMQLGPSRQDEADNIVLREIRELLYHRTCQMMAPRTPTPLHDVDWQSSRCNTPDCDHLGLAYRDPSAAEIFDRYTNPRMTSTPMRELEPVRRQRDPYSDVPNMRADSRNLDDDYRYSRDNYNNNGLLNLDRHSEGRYSDVYNIDTDPRNCEDDLYSQQPNCFSGYQNEPSQNFNNNKYSDEAHRPNYRRHHLPALSEQRIQFSDVENFYLNNRERELQSNKNYAQPQHHFERNLSKRCRNPANMVINLNRGRETNKKRTKTDDTNFMRAKRVCGKTNGRKRVAEPCNETEPKRRAVDKPSKIFVIGGFEMPYIRNSTKLLPQPESQSYAIKFFQRKHCYIIGEREALFPELPVRANLSMPVNFSRALAKRFRLNLRCSWTAIYRNMNYKSWNIWWADFKWCKSAIDKELEHFKGINLKNINLLHVKINFDCVQPTVSIRKLMQLAHLALDLNTTNYQSVLGTIFELMNEKFLEKLSLRDIAELQDLIRYIPNHLWVYKMRSMVYLWSRYSRIRKLAYPRNSNGSKQLYATQTQWNSPIFHWLAKQAYEELITLSLIEWPEHKNIYPLLK